MGYPKNPNARYLIDDGIPDFDDGIPDYDDIPLWYKDNEKVTQRNALLKNRMLLSKARKNNFN